MRELDEIRMRLLYFFRNPEEFPAQLALWWGALSTEVRLAVLGLLAVGVLYILAYLRPAIGSFLAVILPYGWLNTDAMRKFFFRGTAAEFEKSWKKSGQPTRNRARYLADALYYWGPVLIVFGALAFSFIAFGGHPRMVVQFDAR